MIPLRDTNPRRVFPFVNVLLIVLNILAFFWELSLGMRLQGALASIAFVPARFWIPGSYAADTYSIVVSMFLHGGWIHLGSNMLYLWIFGDNVEDRLGHLRYLLFYLLCGFAATWAHAFLNAGSQIPAVGASGAIAGVLGAYLLLFPSARVVTLIPIGFLIMLREIPALFVLGLWFVIQAFSGWASVAARTAEDVGGVAWFAHIGGFLTGLLLVSLFARKQQAQYVRR
jgi:membrane associated rhomboid family serine protease